MAVDGDTVFRIGSTTKTFTGTAVMRLVNSAGAALVLTGRVVEVVTGMPYEQAVRELVIDPLGLARTRFFAQELAGFSVAAPHDVLAGIPTVDPSFLTFPRTLNPVGGLFSSVRDQLRYARFHLGNGTAPGGRRLLTERSLTAMRSVPGPGGTLFVELDGMGVTWMLRPSAEGVRIVQHGGDLVGMHSGFLMVPDRGFAMTVLTNSQGGPKLLRELFTDDWALRRFAAVSNLPARPMVLNASELAPYEGHYTTQIIGITGDVEPDEIQLTADRSAPGMKMTTGPDVTESRLTFYGRDHVINLDPGTGLTKFRADFLRNPDGTIQWLRLGGRLYRRQS